MNSLVKQLEEEELEHKLDELQDQMNTITPNPCVDLPDYSKWTHAQLVAASTNYHQQLVVMYNMIQSLRLELKTKG